MSATRNIERNEYDHARALWADRVAQLEGIKAAYIKGERPMAERHKTIEPRPRPAERPTALDCPQCGDMDALQYDQVICGVCEAENFLSGIYKDLGLSHDHN